MFIRMIIVFVLVFLSACAPNMRVVERYPTNEKKMVEILSGKGDKARATKRITYYSNGKIEKESMISNGKLNGKTISYHPNGSIAIEGKYANNLKNDQWIWTDEHGLLDSIRTFRNGIYNGKTEYYSQNVLIRSIYFSDGNRNGPYKEFFSDGEKKVVGEYISNLPHEKWTWFNNNKGKSREITFDEGIKDGGFKIWDEDQLILSGRFSRDKRIGTWKWYKEKKELDSLVTYGQGVRHGEFKTWHKNGEMSISGKYIEGNFDRQWQWWSDDGHLDSSKTFQNGLLNGLSEFYYKNGQLKSAISYRSGVLDGGVQHYFPSGEIRSVTTYRDGQKHGSYENWVNSNILEEKGFYREDVLNGQIQRWFSNGALASIANFTEGGLMGLTQIFSLSGRLKRELFYNKGSVIARIEYHDNGRFKRVLILDEGEPKYERKWNESGLETTDELFITGTRRESDFYLTGFLKYECIYKGDDKHGMEWWLDADQNPTRVNLYLNGREILRHKISYETTE